MNTNDIHKIANLTASTLHGFEIEGEHNHTAVVVERMISSMCRREGVSSQASSIIEGDEMVMLPRQNIRVEIIPPSSRSSKGSLNTGNWKQLKYNADLNLPLYLYKETKQPPPEHKQVVSTASVPESLSESVFNLTPSKLMESGPAALDS